VKAVLWREIEGGCLVTRLPVRTAVPQQPSGLMPIGKYRGALIADVVEHDPDYVGWLVGQDWFFEKYPRESECLIECMSMDVGGPSAA
jgi:uncharacterized protein (DUF3820 family)